MDKLDEHRVREVNTPGIRKILLGLLGCVPHAELLALIEDKDLTRTLLEALSNEQIHACIDVLDAKVAAHNLRHFDLDTISDLTRWIRG